MLLVLRKSDLTCQDWLASHTEMLNKKIHDLLEKEEEIMKERSFAISMVFLFIALLASACNRDAMTEERMNRMMDEPQHREMMMRAMENRPEMRDHMMQQMMQDPEKKGRMMEMMISDHQMHDRMAQYMAQHPEQMQAHMERMLSDPAHRSAMIEVLRNNPSIREQMQNLLEQAETSPDSSQGQ